MSGHDADTLSAVSAGVLASVCAGMDDGRFGAKQTLVGTGAERIGRE